jgi:hypothetical protein
MIIVGKEKDILTSPLGEMSRQNQEVGTDGIQGRVEIFLGEAGSFEPMNKIGGEQQKLKEGDVGCPTRRGNLAQRVIVEELADVFFDGRPRIVEKIHAPRTDFQVGDENMIDMPLVFEKGQLPCFGGVFGDGTPHHHKPVASLPFLVNFVPELSDLPSIHELLEPTTAGSALDGGVFFGDHDVSAPCSVEETDDPLPIEPRIHPEPNAGSGDGVRHFGEAYLDKGDGSRRCDGVARTQRAMPEFLEMSLETQQGMVGTPTGLLGVVSNSGSFGFAIDHNNDRIQVEHQGSASLGQSKQVSPQAVVKTDQLSNRFGMQAFEKPTQGGLVRETFESQHFEESSIVLQDVRLVDAPQSHNHGKQNGQDQFGRVIVGSPLECTDIFLEQIAKRHLVAKTLDQPHSTEVREVGSLEGKTNFSGSLWHVAQNVHLGRFLPQTIALSHYTFSSSVNHNSLASKMRPFTHF